jgi:hypothetical protein
MKNFFPDADTDFCSLVDYVKMFVTEQDRDFNSIQLPPIQRNAVWNMVQVESLWDSLLRGFPIGSFMLSPRHGTLPGRDLYSGLQQQSERIEYFLLDGQQRTRAILLGFKPFPNARLWIDLCPDFADFEKDQFDRQFLLRMITSDQPWGMNDKYPGAKLGAHLRYEARQELFGRPTRYDYDVTINVGNDLVVRNDASWPIRAVLPVPLDQLIHLSGFTSGRFEPPHWLDVCKQIPARYHDTGVVPDVPTPHFESIMKGLRKLLDTTSAGTRGRMIIFQLHSEPTEPPEDRAADTMETLFLRINAGGTPLEGDELAYSLLKSSWDGCYDIVASIISNSQIGYLLAPTSIVMAAARMARFNQQKPDDANPGVTQFRRWIGVADDLFLPSLKRLLVAPKLGPSSFERTVARFCSLVLYQETHPHDIGLSRKLLLSIKSQLYHPVFIWLQLHLDDEEHITCSRVNILRYLVYCFLVAGDVQKASKRAVSVIREHTSNLFPDDQIYQDLVSEGLTGALPTPAQFSQPFLPVADGFLRHHPDLFALDDGYDDVRHYFWYKKELLLWFQRPYMARWFSGYNPMSGDNSDTPYDWDHILPRSHLIVQGGPLYLHTEDDREERFTNGYNRNVYMNSIGNYRLWPYWGNRSDNNRCHTDKLHMEVTDFSGSAVAVELGLSSTADFFAASAMDIADQDIWYMAGGEPREWPEERRVSWQTAVERRVQNLYKQLYECFGYASWETVS